jgi:pre-mRNA-splicing factor ATP-dependent RNA helicase DHX38/PRP16
MNEEEREEWEQEQKRLDRAWYSIDDGADDEQNPFGNMSKEYMAKKEKQNSAIFQTTPKKSNKFQNSCNIFNLA